MKSIAYLLEHYHLKRDFGVRLRHLYTQKRVDYLYLVRLRDFSYFSGAGRSVRRGCSPARCCCSTSTRTRRGLTRGTRVRRSGTHGSRRKLCRHRSACRAARGKDARRLEAAVRRGRVARDVGSAA